MNLYIIKNTRSNTFYIGITKGKLNRRFSAHICAAKRGTSGKLYDAMRGYGYDCFSIQLIGSFDTYEELLDAEARFLEYVNVVDIKNYNIKPGGERVWGMRDKAAWQEKLKIARKGRKPALGMQHTEENKKLFGAYGKLRWDIYGRYPKEVLNYGFTEAHKRFGISKTHYYRLRKEANDLF